MKNETVYPEWVQAQRMKGTTVKKVGNNYYLYKRTSKRVPGKKYPQPVDTYIGMITPDGLIKKKKTLVATTSVEVKEYGFSKAVLEVCPQDWKEVAGKEWEDKLNLLLVHWSPNSFVTMGNEIKTEEELRFSIASQAATFSRRIYKSCGVGIDKLRSLDTIYAVYMGKQVLISKISAEQQKILDQLKLHLEYY